MRRGIGFWRWLMPVMLIALFLAVLFWLPWQARQMEANERQEQLIADTLWVEQAVRFQLGRNEEALTLLGADLVAAGPALDRRAIAARLDQLQKNSHELLGITWLDASNHPLMRAGMALGALAPASQTAAEHARKTGRGRYSEPYRASQTQMDYHLPLADGTSLVATYKLSLILDETVPWWFAQDNAISLLGADDSVVALRAAAGPGRGVYTHKRELDLPGANLRLATDSIKSAPRLLPNLLVGSVVLLALGLLISLLALWRHIARRLAAEGALRQQMAFRTAMENSLVTGLRARDLEGRVTYVNPAFCQLVGLPPEELVGKAPPMPYWAPEAMAEYQQRFAAVLAGHITPQFETIFQRADGERVPVLIFEAPLVDSNGRQTGWMGSILDISDRKKAEELNRQQQEKLEASARLATMGEISSMLAHELNQPLAAISSYTTGALNLLGNARQSGQPVDAAQLLPALEKASAQAQRAGQIIRSVHQFVKQREPERQAVDLAQLVDGIGALIELQARKVFVAIQVDIAPGLPCVSADRIMLEQVLLNLTRNAIESMQQSPPERRVLRISAALQSGQVCVSVSDQGHGIADEVGERLFSPFFSTKAEGMGMGLSICRTAIEFHGGTLSYRANPEGGTIFSFTLPDHSNHTGDQHAAYRRRRGGDS
ncbi:sensor histidine kinase [Massilia sp. CF038]|uniref:sensor histidine kinase n=1 Tax=Massilia sp. CF038 TaxID=1881045 RepID=UPI0009178814|nr:PAS domain-containing sensor histidine kinase [Massilia sp. CF038]SHG38234.1 PAS/PAC sensor signal transduction histidine kinase [Massilia sp. CF038]